MVFGNMKLQLDGVVDKLFELRQDCIEAEQRVMNVSILCIYIIIF
jgi:hypothetical protein